MLLVNVEHAGEAVILRYVGRIVAGEEVASLKRFALCHQPESKVLVLDLARVESIDGAGLGLLAFLAGWSRVIGTKLAVMDPSRQVRKLLDLTRLSSVVEICSSEDLSAAIGAAALSLLPAAFACHR